MRALLLPLLTLLPLVATAGMGHDAPVRESAETFPLTLYGAGAAGIGLGLGGENCVVVRAQGPAEVLRGRILLTDPDDDLPPAGRLRLLAETPRAAPAVVQGALPLAMEVAPFELRGSGDETRFGVHLPEGAAGVAAGQRVHLTLRVEHAGAPIDFSVDGCDIQDEEDDARSSPSASSREASHSFLRYSKIFGMISLASPTSP